MRNANSHSWQSLFFCFHAWFANYDSLRNQIVCACACVHVHVIGSTLVVLYAHAHVHVTGILSQVRDHVNSTEDVQVFFAPAFTFNTSNRAFNSTEGIATHIVHTRCGPGQTDHGYTFQRTPTRLRQRGSQHVASLCAGFSCATSRAAAPAPPAASCGH